MSNDVQHSQPEPDRLEPEAERLEPDLADAELVPEDDEVIGRALVRSFAVLAVILVIGAGVWLWSSREEPAGPQVEIDVAPPREAVVEAAPAIVFTDVTAAAGVDFVHTTGATGEKWLPETMGGGGGFVDLDGDADPDLVLIDGTDWPGARSTGSSPSVRVYRNDGQGRFGEITRELGITDRFYGMGLAAGDVDGDGDVDLFVTAVGPNRLFLREGDRYVEAAARAGVAGGDDAWSTAASFFDADGDGDLDLMVGDYVEWSPEIDRAVDYRLTGIGRAYGPPVNYQGAFLSLFRNEGGGTFTDVSEAAGLHLTNPATGVPIAKTLALAPFDVDGDGAMDVFVANDTVQNFFLRNLGDGTFEETGELFGLAYDRDGSATGAMGVDAGYYRNDGELGFLIGNFANEMTSVYVSQGDASVFADEAITEGVGAPTRTALSFGLLLLDYDLDGRLDLVQSNGHLEDEIATVDPSQSYRQSAQLFWNAGPAAQRTFALVPPETTGDLARPIVGRGSATADVDGDGDLDLLLLQVGGPPLLLRNDQATGHHWLRVALAGDAGNPEAVGAVVEVTAGGVTQRRQVMPTRSYLSRSEAILTFGLGESNAVDEVRVIWPDGTDLTYPVDGVDRVITLRKEG